MWRIPAGFLFVLLVPPSLIAMDGPVEQYYWTYQEYTSRYSQKQESFNDFSSRVRAKGKRYQGGQDAPVRIAVIYPGMQTSDYWRRTYQSDYRKKKPGGHHQGYNRTKTG